MNSLLVFHEVGIRGGEKLFLNIAKVLIKDKNKVTFICGVLNKIHHPIPKGIKFIKSPIGILFIFLNILKEILNTDIIFTDESPFCLWPTAFLATIFRKKLILVDFEFGNRHENSISIFFAKKVDSAVTINKKLLSYLKSNLSIKNSYYFPIPIDRNIFKKPKKINKFKNKFVIFMPGIIHPAKRQDIAIKTLKIISDRIKNAILIIGAIGKSNYKFELLKLIKKYKLDNKVILKYINDNELKNYYFNSDIVLMCGPIGGLTIAEAIFFKKLAIYPTSGTPPSGPVEELGLGIILKKNDPNKYAKVILDYYEGKDTYVKKIIKDKKIVDSNFSDKQFSKNIISLTK